MLKGLLERFEEYICRGNLNIVHQTKDRLHMNVAVLHIVVKACQIILK